MTKVIVDCGVYGTYGIANVERVRRDGDVFTVFYFFANGEAVHTPFVSSRIVGVTIIKETN